jgi:hypothetical protein
MTMADQPSAPEIIPDDDAIDFLLGAMTAMVDASPSQSLVFPRRDLHFDSSRQLLIEIDIDDIVTIRLINGAPQ